jgi:hypothetical protein
MFFEEVIRENLDIGRPDQVQLIFARSVNRRTPGRFRTRVLTSGVIPSLHVDYKKSRIKQYHKENQALRTETTINDTRDFGVGKSLKNLPLLRQIGFQANRRLLDVQKITQDCALGEVALREVTEPVEVDDQRAAGLRYGQPRVQALMTAILGFALQVCGFTNRELRERLAPLLSLGADQITAGRMTYDLRRLRLHGLIERLPKSHSGCERRQSWRGKKTIPHGVGNLRGRTPQRAGKKIDEEGRKVRSAKARKKTPRVAVEVTLARARFHSPQMSESLQEQTHSGTDFPEVTLDPGDGAGAHRNDTILVPLAATDGERASFRIEVGQFEAAQLEAPQATEVAAADGNRGRKGTLRRVQKRIVGRMRDEDPASTMHASRPYACIME